MLRPHRAGSPEGARRTCPLAQRRVDGRTRAVIEQAPDSQAAAVGWTRLVEHAAATSRRRPPTVGRVVGRFIAANLVGVVLLLAGSVWAGRQAAQDEALRDARHTTDLIATLLVEPNIGDGLP